MTNKEYNRYLSQYYEVLNICSICDMDNIRELSEDSINFNITNDTKEFIDVNYKDILVTFKSVMGCGSSYDKYGGRAILTDTFEVYDKNGNPMGLYKNYGYVEDNDEIYIEKN